MHLMVVVFLVASAQYSSGHVIKEEHGFCRTELCHKIADEILANMNKSVNPCDNFYEFACGGYKARRTIPKDKAKINAFSDIADDVNAELIEMLKQGTEESDPPFVKQLKDIYNSCMDLDAIEEAGAKPLIEGLKSVGGWPVVVGKQWDSSNFDWQDTLITLRKHGFNHNYLTTVSLMEGFKDNTIYTIVIDQTTFGMAARNYYLSGLDDKAVVAYFDLMLQTAQKLGADKEFAKKDLKLVLDFEIKIANLSTPEDQRRDYHKLNNKYTVKELQELAPSVNWLKLLNGFFLNPISESDLVIVFEPEFMKKFCKLIADTDTRTIANYVLWRVVQQSLNSLSKEWRDMLQDYMTALDGSRKEKPRPKHCLDSFQEPLALAFGSYYVNNHFKKDDKEKAEELVKYIKEKFIQELENVEWMDEETKTKAIDKANSILEFIGYPEEILDEDRVTKLYEKLTLTNDDYFKNMLNLNKWSVDYQLSKYRVPNVRGDWEKHGKAAVVNAFYNPSENSIEIPAGILQQEFFVKNRPQYMNFGGIGYVIGHEITHGFDDQGRQFDLTGNLKHWWTKETDKKFRQKAQCIIDQYNNFTTEIGENLNGLNTLGENIADNGGIKTSYLAYQTWTKDHGPELKLPGLSYTPNQLFWLSAANTWCTKYRPETIKLMIYSNVHSTAQFRIIGPMSNHAEFSKDFNCAPGSNMNPENKCKVW